MARFTKFSEADLGVCSSLADEMDTQAMYVGPCGTIFTSHGQFVAANKTVCHILNVNHKLVEVIKVRWFLNVFNHFLSNPFFV